MIIKKCSFCDSKQWAMYLCKNHYFVEKIVPIDHDKCLIRDCTNKKIPSNAGLCFACANKKYPNKKPQGCPIEHCCFAPYNKITKLCVKHWEEKKLEFSKWHQQRK